MIKLPRYNCHKQVEADQIVGMTIGSRVILKLKSGQGVIKTMAWFTHHSPEIGGYFVQYADGYNSYSPAQAFEQGYTLAEQEGDAPFGPSLIISGFPGIGKSTLVQMRPEIRDSDSSKFDKTQFPANYIEHIQTLRQVDATVLVSSHAAVREALVAESIPFTLVYPSLDQKDVYMERYKQRGSPEPFLKLMNENWSNFITECMSQKGCHHYVLSEGMYLADAYAAIRQRSATEAYKEYDQALIDT